jgi:hypothetical protein
MPQESLFTTPERKHSPNKTRQIPPNGCMFCELTLDKHGSRLDGLHPRGVWTWVEPSDKLRLQRMKRNRALRKGNAMTMVGVPLHTLDNEEWLGQWVTYHGNRRLDELGNGQVFKVVSKRDDNGSVGFDAGIFGIQWAAPWTLKLADAPLPDKFEVMSLERAEEILNPYAPAIAALDADIKRYEEKIAELRNLRKGLASL